MAAGCPTLDAFSCTQDQHCSLRADGSCHLEAGACSYPDDGCESRRRYSANAGALANRCVAEEEPELTSSGPDQDGGAGSGDSSGSGVVSSSGDPPLPVCGNGIIEDGEDCDDGEQERCNDCTSDCRRVGIVRAMALYDGHGFSDYFDDVAVDAAGTIVAAGRTATSTDIPVAHNRVVVAYDEELSLAWAATEDVPGPDDLNCVVISPAGEVVAAGFHPKPGGGRELWVGRYDARGAETLLAYGGDRSTEALDCTFATDGQLAVSGVINQDNGTLFEQWDRLVLRDALGDLQVLPVGEPSLPDNRDFAIKIAAAPAGELLAAGNITVSEVFSADRWVARYSATGALLDDFIGAGAGDGNEEILGLAAGDGAVFVAGNLVINDGGNEREWYARLSYDGLVIEWERNLGLDTSAIITEMVLDSDGDLLFSVNVIRSDAAVAKADAVTGDCQWLVHAPAGAARLSGIAVAPDGGIVVTGSNTKSNDDSDGDALIAILEP